jgi:hypothetical protein
MVAYGYDDLYQKMYTNSREKKRPMRGEKSYAGGPEKQVIFLCGLMPNRGVSLIHAPYVTPIKERLRAGLRPVIAY